MINKAIEGAISRYTQGESIPQVADDIGMPRSTLRHELWKRNALRSREEGNRFEDKLSGKSRERNRSGQFC